ncbi:CorA family divalent cation transporter [Paeniroseomonas aquatica]|uniref:CorA family divalent cation transporter n=1 Tax=Paeniroseomonas aquatica TaxID=373043 RepID=UPI003615401C
MASLNDYDARLSDKVQFLLDATLGFISIEQNNTIKILTVVSVVGIPPTLVASIYGMNFHAGAGLGAGLSLGPGADRPQRHIAAGAVSGEGVAVTATPAPATAGCRRAAPRPAGRSRRGRAGYRHPAAGRDRARCRPVP